VGWGVVSSWLFSEHHVVDRTPPNACVTVGCGWVVLSKSLTCLTHALYVLSLPLVHFAHTRSRTGAGCCGVVSFGRIHHSSSHGIRVSCALTTRAHPLPCWIRLSNDVNYHTHTHHTHTHHSLPLTKFSLRQLTNSIVLPAVTMRQIQVTDYVTINPKTEVTVDKRVITVKGKSSIAPPAHTLAHSLLFLRVPFVFASCRASNYVQCRGKC
jgi:hypothetical protein